MLKTGSNSRDRSGITNTNRNTNSKTSLAIEPSSKASSKIPLLIPGSKKRSDSTSTSALPSKEAHFDDKPTPGDIDIEECSEIEPAVELLYGLLHARLIITSRGLNGMHEKFKEADFGCCPRFFFCDGQPFLPEGTSDIPHNGSVKIYCSRCDDIYLPRCKYQTNIDGAYIGTDFFSLFLITYPSAKPSVAVQHYVRKVFGFKLHKDSNF